MATRKRNSTRSRPRSSRIAWLWSRPVRYALLAGIVVGGAWAGWIDYQIRRDFRELQWALPGRIFARPVELYVGAHLGADELVEYLERLGYRATSQVGGPGEFSAANGVVRLQTRGFDFWDGMESSVYAEVGFSGRHVAYLQGSPASGELPLVRLEPVEIAQINPTTGEDRLPVALNEVPQELIDAVIAVEDQRFYSHYGIDPVGIARALVTNLRAGEVVQGGSTLTQQLVKNLYLNQERTLRRKIEEAMMAVALDFHFSKDEILQAYINEVFLGQEGNRAIHGFALAAQHYFGRPLNELRLDELALLAGLPRGASYYNPLRNPERATERRNVVLGRMEELGYISARQLAEARDSKLVTRSRPVNRAGYPAFMELVYDNLERDYDTEALRTEGFRIFTTLDIGIQSTIEEKLDTSVKAVARTDKPLEAAVVITDTATGEVRAMAGGRQGGYTGFNRALHASRQIGSLVKPFVYLAALETKDFNLATVLEDEPVSIRMQDGQLWEPQNYEREADGEVYLYDALQRSLNLATVDLGMKLGLDKVGAMIKRLGYTGPVNPYPSVLLGAVEMTPIEVAQAYHTLASNGFRSPLRAVEAVTTASGEPLAWYGIETEQVTDPASVYLLEYAMQGVFERGTARTAASRLGGSLPLAGKTGTTNDLRDSWFAGFGDDLVGVVWLGHDDNSETGLTGATGALRVWTDLMAELDIQPRQGLAPPEIEWDLVAARAPIHPADRDCSQTISLPFRPDAMQDVAYSCEASDSFFERVMDRFRSL